MLALPNRPPDPEGTEIDIVARHSHLVKDDAILAGMGNSLGIPFWICILDTHCSPSQWAKAGGTYAAGILMLPVVPERVVAAEVGARVGATAFRALKAVNLPAWRKVGRSASTWRMCWSITQSKVRSQLVEQPFQSS